MKSNLLDKLVVGLSKVKKVFKHLFEKDCNNLFFSI